ncbi:PfkB family carbohydrate kinase [Arthrobacter sp. NPDC058192]|uniref:PfkB family carbohydrate kinase n=1 Tax=Arthrobacter sp. NPDC058192 TaxID=3346372 RepID=UPI0036E2B450
MKITVVGDVLLDVDIEGETTRLCPDAPVPVVDVAAVRRRAGGAGLVASMLADDGHEVSLVTVLAGDEAGRTLGSCLGAVSLVAGPSGLPTPVKTRVRAAGRPVVRYDEGCGEVRTPEVTGAMLRAIRHAAVIVVSDYGRGLTSNPRLRAALELAAARVPVIWDPHPKGAAPVPGADVVTPNLAEARGFLAAAAGLDGSAGSGTESPASLARVLRQRWGSKAVLVTLGEVGAELAVAGLPGQRIAAPRVDVADPCGAGDRLAATLALHRARGHGVEEAAALAVRDAAAFLGRGGVETLGRHGPGGPHPAPGGPAAADPVSLARRIQARGGTVVATGGCFDLLHAGHARTLAAAAKLGDCLIVCLNSDASVRRLKGPERPILNQADRKELLESLGAVDAVVVFEEDTPEACLAQLRPDIWVKGGDYDPASLPEAALVESWGGRCAIVPYHPARSTTVLARSLARVS